jgi:hypothetical protein
MYTSKQAALPKSSWQLYPKVLRENKSPGVGLALQASINHKGANKKSSLHRRRFTVYISTIPNPILTSW